MLNAQIKSITFSEVYLNLALCIDCNEFNHLSIKAIKNVPKRRMNLTLQPMENMQM